MHLAIETFGWARMYYRLSTKYDIEAETDDPRQVSYPSPNNSPRDTILYTFSTRILLQVCGNWENVPSELSLGIAHVTPINLSQQKRCILPERT